MCQAVSHRKCSHCLATHYCSRECQSLHWIDHKHHCKQPVPRVERHVVVALPDYDCFWNYENWLRRQNSEGLLGVVILDRSTFTQQFGEDAMRRTILNLAFHGRPTCYVCGNLWPNHRVKVRPEQSFASKNQALPVLHTRRIDRPVHRP